MASIISRSTIMDENYKTIINNAYTISWQIANIGEERTRVPF